LRDLAAPGFHERNTAADLALIFSDPRIETSIWAEQPFCLAAFGSSDA
jgi:hypothetical protein